MSKAAAMSTIPNNGIDLISVKFDKYDMLCNMVISNAASDHNAFTNENAMLITQMIGDFMGAVDHVNFDAGKLVQNFNLNTQNYDEVLLRKIIQEMNHFTQRRVSDSMFFTIRPWSNHDWRIYACHTDSIIDLRCSVTMDTEYADDYNGVYSINARFELI